MQATLIVQGTSEVVRERADLLRRSKISFAPQSELVRAPTVVLLDREGRFDGTLIAAEPGGDAPVYVVPGGGQQSTEAAWAIIQAGATDLVEWNGNGAVEAITDRIERWHTVDELVSSEAVQQVAAGTSPAWLRLLHEVIEIARFTAASVLVTGETGSGKEVISTLIHEFDSRPDKSELVCVDCASVMPTLSGSEFFGHEKGSFTGALGTRRGAIEMADKGTLYLDELGELPLTLQAELLRAIQERSYRRVGSHVWRRSDFRLVCATNRDLDAEIQSGGFRSDLYFRVAEWRCHLPPLRERRHDILPLARHFLREMAPEVPGFDDNVEAFLLLRDYPGNVRDLRQLVLRLAHRHVGTGKVTIGSIPDLERRAFDIDNAGRLSESLFDEAARVALATGASMKRIQHEAAEAAIRIAVDDAGGSLQEAARRLGVTDRALQMRRRAATRRKDDDTIDVG